MGLLYENRFCEACNGLITEGFIDSYRQFPKGSDEDNMGIDVSVRKAGIEIHFQVTSSLDEAIAHQKLQSRHPERPQDVIIVYIREGNKPLMKTVDNLEREIRRKINQHFNGNKFSSN
ncbi:hypothetical protein A3A76_04795 [Candidatus Woesebacteria bacterium RIFCSPLOWO2_01_FULL_39_23]|nr:MAG: hypothetical protein A3E41_01270 [Candidatus Woesebacteria bacterium RIFCSPHIGHO2_12_FULL_38_9]OGM62173.1 MAG: hypothetical protein A3A76_04795 [Candidatus Woesebacteria bacterium RIFCSPLOWO2_01_FULL_39_23]